MPTLNQLMDKGSLTISEIVADFRADKFFVDESFQRRLVWTEKQKVRLIETVMMGYPIPEIYLHRQPPDENEDGLIRHSIVDGQQRVKCLSQFMANEYPVHAKYLDEENKGENYSGLFWGDFSPELKNRVREYSIQHRIIPSDVSLERIRVIFRRLNETDKSLNPQEIRHAEFDGEFIKVAETLANLPFWRKHGVFTDNNIRRMTDVEFTTSLLSLLKNGIVTDSTKATNELYDLFNDKYEDSEKDTKEVKERLNLIDQILDFDSDVSDMFSKPVHLFTLFHLMPDFKSAFDNSEIAKRLGEFVEGYESEKAAEIFENYRSGSIQRTRSKLSRELRRDALKEFVLEN